MQPLILIMTCMVIQVVFYLNCFYLFPGFKHNNIERFYDSTDKGYMAVNKSEKLLNQTYGVLSKQCITIRLVVRSCNLFRIKFGVILGLLYIYIYRVTPSKLSRTTKKLRLSLIGILSQSCLVRQGRNFVLGHSLHLHEWMKDCSSKFSKTLANL